MKINFYMTHEGITFSDSIVLPEGQTMTTEEIEAIKQQRFQQWLEFTAPAQAEAE